VDISSSQKDESGTQSADYPKTYRKHPELLCDFRSFLVILRIFEITVNLRKLLYLRYFLVVRYLWHSYTYSCL